MVKTEVLIVGGGPAGSTCAWHLKRNGVDCLIVDRQSFPRQKLCAGWIQPQVFDDLEMDPSNYPCGLITFPALYISLHHFQLRIPTRQYSIRRYEFDQWLLDRSGVTVKKHEVKNIETYHDHFSIDGAFTCKYLVGAGGTHCPVYRTLFQDISPREKNTLIVSMEYEFAENYNDKKCHLWFLENQLPGYSWYVPKAGGYLNIGIGGIGQKLKASGQHIRDHWDQFVNKLNQMSLVANRSYHPKGYAYYHRGKSMTVQHGNAYILGDAAALATIDMAEGIGPAVKSGRLAAESILTGKNYSVDEIAAYSFKYRWLVKMIDYIFSKMKN
jgi:flavin-dependent dehydrogenase